jgi:TolA-binding protein
VQAKSIPPDFKLAFRAFDRNIARPIMEQKAVQLTLGEKLFVWFEANKKQAAWGAGIVVVLGFVMGYYVWSQGAKEVQAAEALSQLTAASLFAGGQPATAADYLKVADAHAGTPAAAQALLLAGGALYTEGKYAEAHTLFLRFTRDHPGNPFTSQALLGIATSLEAQGKTDEAARAYKEAVDRFPNANTTSQARFGLARSYESQGKLDQARALYEEIAQGDPYGSVGNEAVMRLEALKSDKPVVTPDLPATTNLPAFKLSTP